MYKFFNSNVYLAIVLFVIVALTITMLLSEWTFVGSLLLLCQVPYLTIKIKRRRKCLRES